MTKKDGRVIPGKKTDRSLAQLKASRDAFDLFQDSKSTQTPKAIADRAAARSIATREMAERSRDAAKDVDLKPLPPPVDADEYFAHASAWITGSLVIETARKRFVDEAGMREALGVTLKQVRLLKAGLDGRCNRLKAGLP